MHNTIYICPRGKGYWRECFRDWAIVSGRYVSFDKVVWC